MATFNPWGCLNEAQAAELVRIRNEPLCAVWVRLPDDSAFRITPAFSHEHSALRFKWSLDEHFSQWGDGDGPRLYFDVRPFDPRTDPAYRQELTYVELLRQLVWHTDEWRRGLVGLPAPVLQRRYRHVLRNRPGTPS